MVTLSNKNCRFFSIQDNTEEVKLYDSLSLLNLPDIIKAIQTQFTKDFITSFISEEKYNDYSQNILFNGYVTYHKDNILRYWLQTSYGFTLLECLQLPKNINIFDFLVTYDKTIIVYNNKFEIYSLKKTGTYGTVDLDKRKSATNEKLGAIQLQKSRLFGSKIIDFSYYKQMGM